MNHQNFQQTGGFPLTTNTLSFAQASWMLMQEFGHIAGDLTILNGCEVNGTNVSPGTVFINGEILTFLGGTLGANVVIQETRSQKQFEDGTSKDVEIVRVAKFGNGLTTYPWADFERIMPVKALQKALIPVGMIAMWSGAANQIPAGWVICDGTDGTPNLENKFIRGSLSDGQNIGATGGSDTVNINGSTSNSQVSVTISNSGWGASSRGPSPSNSIPSGRLIVGSGQTEHAESLESLRASTMSQTAQSSHNHGVQINNVENRPAFFTLAFIMFKGE